MFSLSPTGDIGNWNYGIFQLLASGAVWCRGPRSVVINHMIWKYTLSDVAANAVQTHREPLYVCVLHHNETMF